MTKPVTESMGASLYHEFYQRPVGSPEAPASQMAEDAFTKAFEDVIAGVSPAEALDALLQDPGQ